MFDFYYQQGKGRRRLFQAKGTHCSIGSARSNDLIIDSRMMSKRQAELRLEADGVYLRDLGSLSGCWVNRERIVNYGPLSDLDEVAVGDVSLRVKKIRRAFPVLPVTSDISDYHGGLVSIAAEADALTVDAMVKATAEPMGTPDGSTTIESISENILTNAKTHWLNARTGLNKETPDDDPYPSKSVDSTVFGSVESTESMMQVNSVKSTKLVEGPEVSTGEVESADSDHPVESMFDQETAYWGRIVHEQLLFQMDLQRKDVNRMSDDQLRKESSALIEKIIDSLDKQLPSTVDRKKLLQNVLNEAVGLGPLEQFLNDDSITEIMVNNHREIFVEREGKLERSSEHFSSDATVFAVIERIITPLGRRIDESSPIVDARLKDGSRVNAVIPPLALKGPSLTIRKFPKRRLLFSDLIRSGSISPSMVEFLRVCVEMRKNIVVSGGTGSGKTTLLNVLSNFIPNTDRIVTIEDAAELKLVQPNLVSLESRPPNLEGKGAVPIRDLVKNALRMRPDRIVVGECRGGEAIDMLQAMNTGHDGSLTTIHANTPRDVLSRLEVLVLMGGMELPVSAIREQVASAVDMIIQQTRFPCGSRKITRITEVVGVESGTVQLQDIFRYDQRGVDDNRRIQGEFTATGAIPTFYEELRNMGVEVDLSFFRPLDTGALA